MVAEKQGGLMATAAWSFREEEKCWGCLEISGFRAGKHAEAAFSFSVFGHTVAVDIPRDESSPECLLTYQTASFSCSPSSP